MKSGYDIQWTRSAKEEFLRTIAFLQENWTEKEVANLVRELEVTQELVKENPFLFQKTDVVNIRRAVILKLNSLFYHIDEKTKIVTIVSFFNNRRRPEDSE